MKEYIVYLLGIIALALFLTLLSVFLCSNIHAYEARLIRAIDGDTIEVLPIVEGLIVQKVIVRLYGIDCPEMNQPKGRVAKSFVYDMLRTRRFEVNKVRTGVYNRTIAKIVVMGSSLNKTLLRKGLAWHDKRYSMDPAYSDAQLRAKRRRVGLWADENPIPPWKWRWGKRR